MKKRKVTIVELADMYNVTRRTLYKWLEAYETENKVKVDLNNLWDVSAFIVAMKNEKKIFIRKVIL